MSDMLEFEGTVLKAQGNGMFIVQPESMESTILCTLAGKIKMNLIRILEGDKVKIEVSPYDLSKGRITYRVKG